MLFGTKQNIHSHKQASFHQRNTPLKPSIPLASSGLESVGVFGCTGRRWQRSSIQPAPPIGCWSIPLLRPILSSRLILFQLISINICVWVLSTPSPSSKATPPYPPLQWSSMQMLIRNWCIAGGFKVMTSQGWTFTIKCSNPHWQCGFCSTMCLEMHPQAKTVCHTQRTSTVEINRREDIKNS